MRDSLLTEILSQTSGIHYREEGGAGGGGILPGLRQRERQAFVLDVVSVYV